MRRLPKVGDTQKDHKERESQEGAWGKLFQAKRSVYQNAQRGNQKAPKYIEENL